MVVKIPKIEDIPVEEQAPLVLMLFNNILNLFLLSVIRDDSLL